LVNERVKQKEVMMGEDRIKSALELAMEKVAGMPKLDPAEIRAQRERTFFEQGAVLAQKYLQSKGRNNPLSEELAKMPEADARWVKKGCFETLCRQIELDPEKNQPVFEALTAARPEVSLEQAQRRVQAVISDYLPAITAAYRDLEKKEKAALKKIGITGSAVYPNLPVNPRWRTAAAAVRESFQKRLQPAVENLLGSLDAG
jgi:hypothetical protein